MDEVVEEVVEEGISHEPAFSCGLPVGLKHCGVESFTQIFEYPDGHVYSLPGQHSGVFGELPVHVTLHTS